MRSNYINNNVRLLRLLGIGKSISFKKDNILFSLKMFYTKFVKSNNIS